MEAPERSNLGLDCSGCEYWETALNPNYQYFTLTNDQFYSNGVITLVLGTAKPNHGEVENIAFIDKVQNVPIPMVLTFIEVLRQMMASQGYTLAMSKHLNQNRDDVLSNDKELQEYLLQHLTLDKLDLAIETFVNIQQIWNFQMVFHALNILVTYNESYLGP